MTALRPRACGADDGFICGSFISIRKTHLKTRHQLRRRCDRRDHLRDRAGNRAEGAVI